MNIPDIIIKKKNGGELSRDDIKFFVDGVVKRRVQESQIASIISKKAAEGIDALVLDVKFGDGSLIPEKDRARELATDMVRTGCDLGMKTIALLTSMESPLGYMVGNALEVAESVTCLHGKGPDDLTSLVVTLGGHLLYSVGKSASLETGAEEIRKSIQDGRALKTFCSMLKGQRVDSNIAEGLCRAGADVMDILKRADNTKDLLSPSAGYVSGISAKTCAVVTKKLGGGRFKAGGTIDHAVGLQLLVTVGDWIEAGSPWVRVHYNGEFSASLQSTLQQSLTLTLEKINVNGSKNRVAEVITNSKQDPIDDNGQIV